MSLPTTWRTVRLGDVCQVNPRLEPSEKPDGDTLVSFVPMNAVDEVFGEITTLANRPYKEVAKGFTPFKDGDVLFAKITPSMENGKAAIAKGLMNGIGFGSTEFHVMRPSEQLLPEFLFYFLRQPVVREHARAAFVGSAGQQRVPTEFLERLKIPLPTILEQQHLILYFKEIVKLRRVRIATLDSTRNLTSKLFISIFGHPTEGKLRWENRRIGDISEISYGIPEKLDTTLTADKGYRIITISNVTLEGEIDSSIERYCLLSTAHIEKFTIEKYDLLFNWRNGSSEHVGKTAIWEADNSEPTLHVSFLLKLRGDRQYVEPYYLWAVLNLYRQLGFYRATARTQVNTKYNASELSELKIPMPPLHLQQYFTARLFQLRNIRNDIKLSAEQIDDLSLVISKYAFAGELEDNWRESHLSEIKVVASARDEAIGKDKVSVSKVTLEEHAPEQRRWQSQIDRKWIREQLSELQSNVWKAIEEWRGTLIPSEVMAEFMKTWPVEHLEKADDQILRALDQLAGLGLIAKITLRNQEGEYVAGYRGFREEEFTNGPDIEALTKPQRAFSDAFGPGFQ